MTTTTTTMSGVLLAAVQKREQRDRARARLRVMDEELASLVGQLDPDGMAEYEALTSDGGQEAVDAVMAPPEQPAPADELEAGVERFWEDDQPTGPLGKLRDLLHLTPPPSEGSRPFGDG